MNTTTTEPAPKKKVLIETWGCQMNVADSERMASILGKENYEQTSDVNEANLVLLNTCHIREKSTQKVLSRLGVLNEMKQERGDLRIAVAGCVAQAEGKRLMDRVRYIDALVGPGKIDELPNLLKQQETTGERGIALGFDRHLEPETTVHAVPSKEITRFVNIAQGCNNYCTFCIVPHTRGREISRQKADIINEVRKLVELGAKEITLLGQNVNSYGLDEDRIIAWDEVTPFAELLADVAEIAGVERLRFTTSNPHDFSKPVADLFRTQPKLGRYIHLPVQSGNDQVLNRMKRKVTVEQYLERIKWLREAVPDIAISTDLIVGFPGETEEQFEDTLSLVEKIGYSFIYCFKYSPRKGTPAARFVDQIEESVKDKRLAKLNQLQDRITVELNQADIGKVVPVLFHYDSQKDPGITVGRTEHFRAVRVRSDRSLVGEIHPVLIERANKIALEGRLV
jgi:tRNA-2-methylthio-N6-dimethylallyladenosine synthase